MCYFTEVASVHKVAGLSYLGILGCGSCSITAGGSIGFDKKFETIKL